MAGSAARNAGRRLGVVVVVGSLAGGGLLQLIAPYAADADQLAETIRLLAEYRWTAVVLFAVIAAGGLLAYPIMPISVVAGAVYGYAGGWLVGGALVAGMVSGFAAGRWAGFDPDRQPQNPRMARVLSLIENNGAVASALVRFVPGLPFALQNALMGSSGVRMPQFLLGSIPAAFLTNFIWFWLGITGLETVARAQRALENGWIVQLVGVVIGCALFAGAGRRLMSGRRLQSGNDSGTIGE